MCIRQRQWKAEPNTKFQFATWRWDREVVRCTISAHPWTPLGWERNLFSARPPGKKARNLLNALYQENWLWIGHFFLNHGNPHVPISVLHCPSFLKCFASKFGSGGSGSLGFAIRCFLAICCLNICFINLLLLKLCCWTGFWCLLWWIYCFLFCIIRLRFFHCWVGRFWVALCIFAFLVAVCICCGIVIFSVAFSCPFPTTFPSTSSSAFPCCVFRLFSIIHQPFCSIPGCLTNLASRLSAQLYIKTWNKNATHAWTDCLKGYIICFAFCYCKDPCRKDTLELWVFVMGSRYVKKAMTLAFAWACKASTSPASPGIMDATCASQQKKGSFLYIYICIYFFIFIYTCITCMCIHIYIYIHG